MFMYDIQHEQKQDSLLNRMYKNRVVMDGEGFELAYDLIVLDEREVS